MAESSVLFIYQPNYPEYTTGGELFLNEVYKYFKSVKKEVYIIGNRNDNNSRLKKIVSGFRMFRLVKGDSVIICTNNECLHFYLPLLFRKIFFHNVKIYLIIHHLIQSLSHKKLLNYLETAFIRKTDFQLTISEATKAELVNRKILSDNIKVVNPGTDIIPHNAERLKNQILFVGNIEERKGLHVIIRALSKIKNQDYRLIIVGDFKRDKKYTDRIKKMIDQYKLGEKIFFKGKISDEELIKLYSESEIFIFSSELEGYGLSLIDAMKCGLAVIASDISSTKEIVTDGIDGILYKKDDYEMLAEKLNMLMTDSDLRNMLAENSLKRSKSFNSWNETCKLVYEAFTEAMI